MTDEIQVNQAASDLWISRKSGEITQCDDTSLEESDMPGTLNFWCKMRYWDPREAAALVLGVLPTDLTEEISSSAAFASLERLIARIASKGDPKPTFVLARLKRLKVAIPEGLEEKCWQYNRVYNSKSMKNSELRKALEVEQRRTFSVLEFGNGRAKNSLLAIAYATLRLKYGSRPLYEPKISADLQDMLGNLNFTMTERTLDDWIREINEFGQSVSNPN